MKLAHAAASLARTGIGGLSSWFGVFVRMVIGSSFERSGPSAGLAAGVHVRMHERCRTPYAYTVLYDVRCTIDKSRELRRPVSAREQRQVTSVAGLSKQRVVVEAVRLADRDGVDGLSMRR